jgi:CRISPR-associated protein Csm3
MAAAKTLENLAEVSMSEIKHIQLIGRVFLTFDLRAVTSLHIGGSDTGIEIGGVDKTVIRDKILNRPYVPGSSLKGKIRSLVEKYHGKIQNQRIGQGYIHSCDDGEEYGNCQVCQVFGVPGERKFATPTRLVVRDTFLSKTSVEELEKKARTDLPYTEVKTEVSIDRVTSAANPRQMERVPAGVVFGGVDDLDRPQPAEMVYTIYSGDDCDPIKDIDRLEVIVEGLQLLEDDYLGGLGSRGSGKVKLENIHVRLRDNNMGELQALHEGALDLDGLKKALPEMQKKIRTSLKVA